MNIGAELRKRKHDLGMPLAVIAERAKVSKSTVARALSDNYVKVGIFNMLAIIHVLGFRLDITPTLPAK